MFLVFRQQKLGKVLSFPASPWLSCRTVAGLSRIIQAQIMTQLLSWLRYASVIFFFYVLLMKEDREGVWENRLESWLKRVYAHQETSFAKVTALAKATASAAKSSVERLFGTRLLSLRFLAVSIFYGLASFNLTVLVSPLLPHKVQTPQITLPAGSPSLSLFQSAVWLVVFLMLGSAPALLQGQGRVSRLVWFIYALFFVRWAGPLFIVAKIVDSHWGHYGVLRFGVGLLLLIGINFALDVLFVATTRWLLATASDAKRAFNVLLAILLDAALGYGVIVGPVWFGLQIFLKFNQNFMTYPVMLVFAFKSMDLVIALTVLVLLLLIAIHMAVWFFLERPVNLCLRYKLIRDKKFIRSAIIALLALPKVGTVWAFTIALLRAF